MITVTFVFAGNQQTIFYPGQIMAGQVYMETLEQIRTSGIRLEVTGKAQVMWMEEDRVTNSDGSSYTNSRTYTGNETYMDFSIYLARPENNKTEIFLQPGVHTYPFSILLPPTLPSSFQGQHGSVTYKMRVVLDRSMRLDNSAEISITIVRLLDLNYEPQHLKEPLLIPVHLQTGPCYSCCGIKGIPQMTMTLNRGCFVAGETMVVGGQIENCTNTKIDSIVVDFMQHIEFWANYSTGGNYRSTSSCNVLASVLKPAIDCGQTQNLDGISFNIPPLFASRLDGCSIINIMYFIQVRIVFPKCCSSGFARQDVVIGNVPLHTSTITSQPQAYSPSCPSVESNNRQEPMNCGGISNAGFEVTECRQITAGSSTNVEY